MNLPRRAALAALMLACTLCGVPFTADAAAQARREPATPVTRTAGAPQTPARPAAAPAGQLPAARARPPASRQARPAPAPAPVRERPPVKPAANPAPMPANATVPANGETWGQITPQVVNEGSQRFPVGRGHLGPSVLRVQVLLDRALFSPGMLDARWGKNTQNAVYWLQAREGLPTTGAVDEATFRRLGELAGHPAEIVRAHTLTADDVRGPFRPVPANIYEHARAGCSCYESLSEKLTESFHLRLDLLQKLNPGVKLDSLKAGDVIHVPNTRDMAAPPAGAIAALVISGTDNYLQALDAQGRILYHFAATLGSTYDPSPEGDFRVTSVHENPWWRYQPRLLAHVPDDRPEASIPPGPNNAVGRVWMALSAPHYGIHGTKSPETIGYATSAGCVRLTNWDVLYLSKRIPAGTPVQFRATRTRPEAPRQAGAAQAPQQPSVLGVRADSTHRDSARVATDSTRAPAPKPDSARTDSARADSARTPPAAAPKPDTPAAVPPPAPKPDSAAATPPAPKPAVPATTAPATTTP